MSTPRLRLGQLLVDANVLSPEQLEGALIRQKLDGRRLGTLLVEMGLVDETQLTQILSQQLNAPWVSLYHIEFSRQLLNLIPREVAEKYCLIPIYIRNVRGQGNTLYVAMDDPSNEEALKSCAEHAQLPARSMIAPPSDIWNAIRVYYGARPSMASIPDGAMLAAAAEAAQTAKIIDPSKNELTATMKSSTAIGDRPPAPEPARVSPAKALASTLTSVGVPPPDTHRAPPPEADIVASRRSEPPPAPLEATMTSHIAAPQEEEPEAVPIPEPPPSRRAATTGRSEPPPASRPTPISVRPDPPPSRPPQEALHDIDVNDIPTIQQPEPVHSLDQQVVVRDKSPSQFDVDEDSPEIIMGPAQSFAIPQPKKGPRMVSLTLLDGTTITLPAKKERPASAAPLRLETQPAAPTPVAEVGPELGDDDVIDPGDGATQLTARDLVAALRAVSHGADASDILGPTARWEAMFSALLSLLLKKHLIADWEFIEEFKKI